MVWSPAAARRLHFKRRQDVIVAPVVYADRRLWSLKDPVSLRFYQLREEEFRIYQLLDGPVSLEEIRERFESEFAPQRLSLPQLQSFLGMLHHEGLLLVDTPGQWPHLLEQGRKRRRQALWERFANPLAIRFRGFDPNRLLDDLQPKLRWLFHPLAVCGMAMFVLAAILLLAVQWQSVVARLPDFEAFFGLRNALLLAVVLSLAKVLHEFGHALTCRHFGGEVPEMGVMFLVFTPCLYVNVSDAWLLPSKWQRIAISGAGIVVEAVLAALCTFLWWFSQPGLLNTLCLNMAFVCSLNTLLFNGNPLLRYDGYYVLADWLEIPNMRQQAGALVKQWCGRFFLGCELQNTRFVPDQRRGLLATYWIASTIYRWIVLITILWFLHSVLQPYRLEILVGVLAAVVIAGAAAKPVTSLFKFVRNRTTREEADMSRLVFRGGCVLALLAIVVLVPLPQRVAVPVIIQPADAHRVYASVDGILVHTFVEPGDTIAENAPIAQLENSRLAQEILVLDGRIARQQAKVAGLSQLQLVDRSARASRDAAEEVLNDLKRQRADLGRDNQRLSIMAPVAGIVLPAEPRRRQTSPGTIPRWEGTLLQPRNLGTAVETGMMICQIGDPEKLEAVLVINQAEIEQIRSGQRVQLRLSEIPGRLIEGEVIELARVDLKIAPRQLLRHEDLPTRTDADGNVELLETSYLARVKLDDKPQVLLGATGTAYVHADSASLASRFVRYLHRTFRFDL